MVISMGSSPHSLKWFWTIPVYRVAPFIKGDNMSSMVNKSGVKEYITVMSLESKNGLRISEDFYVALEDEIRMCVDKAIKRTIENNRTTLKGKDL